MTTENYYEHINDFGEMKAYPNSEIMPKDIKRIFKHCSHTYYNRIYFFSESEKQFYRYYQNDPKNAYIVYSRKQTKNASDTFSLIPDEDDGTPNTRNYRDNITVSKLFLTRVKSMNKIELENLCEKRENRKKDIEYEKIIENDYLSLINE